MAFYDEYYNIFYNPDDDNAKPGMNLNWKKIQKGFYDVAGKETQTDETLTGIQATLDTLGTDVGQLHDDIENITDNILYYVTPEQFGAKGDGVTDDTSAIQAAIDAGAYVIMKNAYAISDSLIIKSDLTIDGKGTGIINKLSDNKYSSILYNGDNIGNVIIEGLTITGKKQWTGQGISGLANDYGIRIINGNNIKIMNNRFTDFGACAIAVAGATVTINNNIIVYTDTFSGAQPNYNFGIEYSGAYFTINNNTISGVIHGIISGLLNHKAVICNNDISTNGQHGLYIEGCDDVIVINNYIHNCTLCGIKFQENDSTIQIFRNAIISNNVIKNCGEQGILIVRISGNAEIVDVHITDNIISDCTRGIDISYAARLYINGNTVNISADGGYAVRMAYASRFTITENRISTTDAYGIFLADTTSEASFNDIVITNNAIKATKTTATGNNIALRINSIIHGIIQGNIIMAVGENMTGTDGIFLSNTATSCIDLLILDNICRNFRWDLRALNAAGCTASGNLVTTITGIAQT